MAIQTPHIDTHLDSHTYDNPNQDNMNALLRQSALAGLEGANHRKGLALEALLKGKEQEKAADLKQKDTQFNIDKAKQLADDMGTGGSAKVGDVAAGADPTAKMARQTLSSQSKAIDTLNKSYNKGLDSINKQIEGASNMADVLNTSGPGSVGRAKAAVLGLFGLKRFNEAETSANVPPSLKQSVSKMSNLFGNDTDSLQDSQRQELARFAAAHTQSLMRQHQSVKDNALGQYASGVYADPGKVDTFKQTLGAPTDSHLKELQDTFGKLSGPSQGNQAPTQGGKGLIPSAVGGLKSLLFGNKPQAGPSPQSQPQQQGPAPQGPQQAPPPPQPATIRVRLKATGQTGTLPANEFNPAQHDKL